MKITENEDAMILRDVPVSSWLIGVLGLLLFGGAFLGQIFYAFYYSREAFGSVMAVVVYTGILGILAAFTVVFIGFILSSVATTRIDRKLQSVEITKRNILRKNIESLEFSQLKRFAAEKMPSRTGWSFFIVLKLKNNREIELGEKSFSQSGADEIVARLNRFAGFPAEDKLPS